MKINQFSANLFYVSGMIGRLKLSLAKGLITPWKLLCLMACGSFAVEALIVDRKYGLFTGGFGQSKMVSSVTDYLMLLPGAVALHVLLFGVLWLGLSRIHRKRPKGYVLLYNLLLGGTAFLSALAAKYEILSMFSDAISFKLIKSIGGDSVRDAGLFVLENGGWASIAALAIPLLYLLGLRIAMKYDPKHQIDTPAPIKWKPGFAIIVGTIICLLFVNQSIMARYASTRFTAFSLVNSIFEQASDLDRDGYSWFSVKTDRHPFDPSRHPFALDIPNNGIDEDELGGDLKLGTMPQEIIYKQYTGKKPHIIHVVFESARYDVLGKRINGKPVAPNLEALAASGSYRRAYSPLGFTTGSLKAMFSGRIEPPVGTSSLFEDFKTSGYHISVFSGQAEGFGNIAGTLRSDTLADIFIDAERLKDQRVYGLGSLASLALNEQVLLKEFEKSHAKPEQWLKPNYVYFNFQASHFPYAHDGMSNLIEPKPIPRAQIGLANRDWVQRTYWNALAYEDMMLGKLVGRLKQLGVWDDTILIISGDHGEDLFEDGFLGHGHIINSRQYNTLFVTNKPGYGGGPIGLVDYRSIVHAMIGGTAAPERTEPILMHIGPLDTPAAIGMVDQNNHISVYSLDKNEVQLSEGDAFKGVEDLPSVDQQRLDQLITLWARERWRHHLSKKEVKQH